MALSLQILVDFHQKGSNMRVIGLLAFATALLVTFGFAAPMEKRSAPDISQEVADPAVGIGP
jgi:hypothetical protein